MVNVAPIVAATAALNAATAALNAANATSAMRRRNGGRRAPTEEEIKKNQEYKDNEKALSEDYAKAYKSACASIDDSKTVVENRGKMETCITYYDDKGNLLIRETALTFMIDGETTTEIYSPYSGKKLFSNRVYHSPEEDIEHITHYDSEGNDDTQMYAKKKMLEAKRDKEKAKKRLRRMKLNRVFHKGR